MVWSLLAIVLLIAVLAVSSLLVSVVQGRFLSLGVLAGVLVAAAATWFARHLFLEARRLGKLLKDPGLIMRSQHDPNLVSGLRWSSLNPLSRRRRQEGRRG